MRSRYERRLADAAVASNRVVIQLGVRRFFCDNADFQVAIFAEQVAGLTVPYGRRTTVRRMLLESIGLALADKTRQALEEHPTCAGTTLADMRFSSWRRTD